MPGDGRASRLIVNLYRRIPRLILIIGDAYCCSCVCRAVMLAHARPCWPLPISCRSHDSCAQTPSHAMVVYALISAQHCLKGWNPIIFGSVRHPAQLFISTSLSTTLAPPFLLSSPLPIPKTLSLTFALKSPISSSLLIFPPAAPNFVSCPFASAPPPIPFL